MENLKYMRGSEFVRYARKVAIRDAIILTTLDICKWLGVAIVGSIIVRYILFLN